MGWSLTPQNILAAAAAPFTAGASLLFAKDDEGYGAIDNITGAKSAREAEKRQKQYQDETNQLSIELANSAHQREVADLKAAGLNPILSAGGTGAATPALGTSIAQNEMPGGIMNQALQAANIKNTISSAKQMDEQTKAIPSQIELNNSQRDLNEANAELADANLDFYEQTGMMPGGTITTSSGGGGPFFNMNSSTSKPISARAKAYEDGTTFKQRQESRRQRRKNERN